MHSCLRNFMFVLYSCIAKNGKSVAENVDTLIRYVQLLATTVT